MTFLFNHLALTNLLLWKGIQVWRIMHNAGKFETAREAPRPSCSFDWFSLSIIDSPSDQKANMYTMGRRSFLSERRTVRTQELRQRPTVRTVYLYTPLLNSKQKGDLQHKRLDEDGGRSISPGSINSTTKPLRTPNCELSRLLAVHFTCFDELCHITHENGRSGRFMIQSWPSTQRGSFEFAIRVWPYL